MIDKEGEKCIPAREASMEEETSPSMLSGPPGGRVDATKWLPIQEDLRRSLPALLGLTLLGQAGFSTMDSEIERSFRPLSVPPYTAVGAYRFRVRAWSSPRSLRQTPAPHRSQLVLPARGCMTGCRTLSSESLRVRGDSRGCAFVCKFCSDPIAARGNRPRQATHSSFQTYR